MRALYICDSSPYSRISSYRDSIPVLAICGSHDSIPVSDIYDCSQDSISRGTIPGVLLTKREKKKLCCFRMM